MRMTTGETREQGSRSSPYMVSSRRTRSGSHDGLVAARPRGDTARMSAWKPIANYEHPIAEFADLEFSAALRKLDAE